MEAFYFLLGAVVVLTVANVIGALIAFSKIKQLNHSIDNLDDRINYFNNEISDVYERISDVGEDIQRQLDSRLDKLEDKLEAKLTSKKLIKG